MNETALRLGLIGAGPWGRNYISTIGALPGIGLARIASANPETAALAGPDCAVTADWREVATADDLDGVIVASPPPSHLEIAEQAVAVGHGVLIEKPLALDADAAGRFLDFARERDAVAMVDHTYLFHPAYRRLKQYGEERGPVRSLRMRAGRWGPFRDDTPVLWDWGAHDVAMAIDLADAVPDTIRIARTERRELGVGIGESFTIGMDFAELTADIAFSNIREERTRRVEAELSDGLYVFDDVAGDALRGPDGATTSDGLASVETAPAAGFSPSGPRSARRSLEPEDLPVSKSTKNPFTMML